MQHIDIDNNFVNLTYSIKLCIYLQRIRFNQNDEMLKQVSHDIRSGIVGSNDFEPFYTIVVTWKNVTFTNKNDTVSNRTNTYQLILATDEIRTYAIFNYIDVIWDNFDATRSPFVSIFYGGTLTKNMLILWICLRA